MTTLKNPTPAQRAFIKAASKALRTADSSLADLKLDSFSRRKMEDPIGLNADGAINSKSDPTGTTN